MEEEFTQTRLETFNIDKSKPIVQMAVKYASEALKGGRSFVCAIEAQTGVGRSSTIPAATIIQMRNTAFAKVFVTKPRRVAVDGLFRYLRTKDQMGNLVGSKKGGGEHDGLSDAPLMYVTDGYVLKCSETTLTGPGWTLTGCCSWMRFTIDLKISN